METLILLTQEKQIDRATGYRCRLVSGNRENFILHYHDYYEIFITLNDSVEHYINGEKLTLKKGDLVFIRPNDRHRYTFRGSDFTFINFAFNAETYSELKDYLKSDKFLGLELFEFPPTVNVSEADIEWIKSVVVKLNQIDVDDTDGKRTEFRIFLMEVFSKHFFKRALEYANQNGSEIPFWLSSFYIKAQEIENFSLPYSELVSKSGKSQEHLIRCFKKAYGINLADFQHQQRLNYVANALLASPKKIIDIFLEVGYDDVSWATVLFKKKFGMSPSLYRKKNWL